MNNPSIPHNREAEEALLGSLMINPSLIPTINLEASAFYIRRNGTIFAAMQKIGDGLDIITLSEELDKNGELDQAGGMSYLTGLITQVPASYNAEHYAKIVRDHARNRNDIQIANMIAQGAYNGGVDRAKVVDLLTKNADTSGGAKKLSESLGEFCGMVEERAKDPKDIWGIPTGLIDLDRRTGGVHKQQTEIIVGSPGVGKTTLLLQRALYMARTGHPGAIYELEMDIPRLVARRLMMLTRVPTPA